MSTGDKPVDETRRAYMSPINAGLRSSRYRERRRNSCYCRLDCRDDPPIPDCCCSEAEAVATACNAQKRSKLAVTTTSKKANEPDIQVAAIGNVGARVRTGARDVGDLHGLLVDAAEERSATARTLGSGLVVTARLLLTRLEGGGSRRRGEAAALLFGCEIGGASPAFLRTRRSRRSRAATFEGGFGRQRRVRVLAQQQPQAAHVTALVDELDGVVQLLLSQNRHDNLIMP